MYPTYSAQFVHIYPQLSTARYSFLQLSELRQRGLNEIAQSKLRIETQVL